MRMKSIVCCLFFSFILFSSCKKEELAGVVSRNSDEIPDGEYFLSGIRVVGDKSYYQGNAIWDYDTTIIPGSIEKIINGKSALVAFNDFTTWRGNQLKYDERSNFIDKKVYHSGTHHKHMGIYNGVTLYYFPKERLVEITYGWTRIEPGIEGFDRTTLRGYKK